MTMSNDFINRRLEFHILQSFPVSCLNRDDVGSPKSAIVGGEPRARVSSQCWKRAVRLALHDELNVNTAKRTKFIIDRIATLCKERGANEQQAVACGKAVVSAFSESKKKNKEKGKAESQAPDEKEAETSTKDKSDVIYFISDYEATAMADKFAESKFTPNINATEICKKAFNPARDGLDIALFGRMVADAPAMNIEAAASFAHAISTHRAVSEIDFFAAVDDCEHKTVQLGTLEFNSATYYRYVSLDLGQLATSFHGADIAPAVEAFTRALFVAFPSARQATMAAATPWDYAIVALRKGQRLQMSFNTPVRADRQHPDLVANSIQALRDKFAEAERMYGSMFGLLGKFEIGGGKGSIDDICSGIGGALHSIATTAGGSQL